jgi:cytidine deaminase
MMTKKSTKPKDLILSEKEGKQLHNLALKALKKSYSPYSQYRVGSSVLFTNQVYSSGCNIENASYGATVCAERVAIWSGISERKTRAYTPTFIKALCVVTEQENPWPPCGQCLQVISEFQNPKGTLILLGNTKGILREFLFQDLMPLSFSPHHLR